MHRTLTIDFNDEHRLFDWMEHLAGFNDMEIEDFAIFLIRHKLIEMYAYEYFGRKVFKISTPKREIWKYSAQPASNDSSANYKADPEKALDKKALEIMDKHPEYTLSKALHLAKAQNPELTRKYIEWLFESQETP